MLAALLVDQHRVTTVSATTLMNTSYAPVLKRIRWLNGRKEVSPASTVFVHAQLTTYSWRKGHPRVRLQLSLPGRRSVQCGGCKRTFASAYDCSRHKCSALAPLTPAPPSPVVSSAGVVCVRLRISLSRMLTCGKDFAHQAQQPLVRASLSVNRVSDCSPCPTCGKVFAVGRGAGARTMHVRSCKVACEAPSSQPCLKCGQQVKPSMWRSHAMVCGKAVSTTLLVSREGGVSLMVMPLRARRVIDLKPSLAPDAPNDARLAPRLQVMPSAKRIYVQQRQEELRVTGLPSSSSASQADIEARAVAIAEREWDDTDMDPTWRITLFKQQHVAREQWRAQQHNSGQSSYRSWQQLCDSLEPSSGGRQPRVRLWLGTVQGTRVFARLSTRMEDAPMATGEVRVGCPASRRSNPRGQSCSHTFLLTVAGGFVGCAACPAAVGTTDAANWREAA